MVLLFNYGYCMSLVSWRLTALMGPWGAAGCAGAAPGAGFGRIRTSPEGVLVSLGI